MRAVLVVIFFAASVPAAAHDCIKPVQPVLPDRSTADIAAQNAAVESIDAYIASMNLYLACLEAADRSARAEVEALVGRWEAPIDDLEIVVE